MLGVWKGVQLHDTMMWESGLDVNWVSWQQVHTGHGPWRRPTDTPGRPHAIMAGCYVALLLVGAEHCRTLGILAGFF